MVTEDQSATVEFLSAPSTHGGAAVERIETHASIVFLAGERAWKLKRAVRYDYLDFSTPDRRRAMCEAEVRINRRTAPALYRGVTPIVRGPDATLALGGDGTPVDWVVEMARFDQEGLLDRLAANGTLQLAVMRPLASAIALFHKEALPRADHGGSSGMAWVIDGNDAGLREQGAGSLDSAACARVTAAARRAWTQQAALLDARRAGGYVRQCHGDLHLRNIVLVDGRPTLFDGIEFNDEIACTDVLYDLAFLLMDLWHRGLPRHASLVWNGYLAESADESGIPLLPLFLSCRAAVRAKTSVTAANLESHADRRRELQAAAGSYLTLAEEALRPRAAGLLAVGGLSGSGKSTVALALAPALGAIPGAVVIRTDEVRKQLCGVEASVRLGPEGYTAEMSARVYAAVADRARAVVQGGYCAMVDGVFARPGDRDAMADIAREMNVPFAGLWLEAPAMVRIARAQRRRFDPSDADAEVINAQLASDIGPMSWDRIDASGPLDTVIQQARLRLSARAPGLLAPAALVGAA